ncbi:MAG TPA: hypothetical protein VLU41_06495, partial [Ideonella sp.]|nr:hypothetical protein [Ideonella sp.]
MTPRAIMVWGCSSGAGKSLLATALCRWAARRGIAVAPFKAQNMSNNARVVAGTHGRFGEIGAAQYFQALAARVEPTVDMNPVLLKPEHDTASQVVVHGRVDPVLSRRLISAGEPAPSITTTSFSSRSASRDSRTRGHKSALRSRHGRPDSPGATWPCSTTWLAVAHSGLSSTGVRSTVG